MRAISLWQPWASAIALGAKRVETRSWPTHYRGPIAIHAAKRCVKSELLYFECCWNWQGALNLGGFGEVDLATSLPFGAVVAVAKLVECRPTEEFTVGELDERRVRLELGKHHAHYAWTERMMGDFSPGRYGWVLANVKPLTEPFRIAAIKDCSTLMKGYWRTSDESKRSSKETARN